MRLGPQPYEGIISDICEAFGCTPREAEAQDWTLVQAVMDYRAAVRARALINGGQEGFEALAEQPGLQQILLLMTRAQRGVPLDAPSRRGESWEHVARAYAPPPAAELNSTK